jgi:hypothetical protein
MQGNRSALRLVSVRDRRAVDGQGRFGGAAV